MSPLMTLTLTTSMSLEIMKHFNFINNFFLYFRLLVSVKGQCHFYMLMKFEVFYRNEIYCIIYVHTERQLLKARWILIIYIWNIYRTFFFNDDILFCNVLFVMCYFLSQLEGKIGASFCSEIIMPALSENSVSWKIN